MKHRTDIIIIQGRLRAFKDDSYLVYGYHMLVLPLDPRRRAELQALSIQRAQVKIAGYVIENSVSHIKFLITEIVGRP